LIGPCELLARVWFLYYTRARISNFNAQKEGREGAELLQFALRTDGGRERGWDGKCVALSVSAPLGKEEVEKIKDETSPMIL
jgi:hypothetical protein